MMPTWAYVIGAIGVGGIASAIFVFIQGKRTTSGGIKSSVAEDLWKESAAIRDNLSAQIESLRAQLTAMEIKLAEANARAADASAKAAELRLEVLELRRICGITNEGVELIQREMSAVTPRRRRKP